MNDFAKMDVFFVVTTLAVLLVCALIAVALIRVLRILKNVEKVSDIVSEESVRLRSDIQDLRSTVKVEGFKWKSIAKFIRLQVEKVTGKKS